MKYFLIVLLFMRSFIFAQYVEEQQQKQPKEFTYSNDRIFERIEDFHGYSFVPVKGKLSAANFEDPIKLGSVILKIESASVTITEKTIFTTSGVKGENESRPYKMGIANTKSALETKYYFEMVLVDYMNPNIQGYIHFYVDKGYCYKILFKPESVASERTYYLNTPPYHINVRDSKFFTHDFDLNVLDIDSMMGQIVYPFSEYIDNEDFKDFTRIYPDDGMSFKFELKKIKKGKREKLLPYLVFTDGRDKENEPKNYLIKKAKETKFRDYTLRKDRECLLLTTIDDLTKKEQKIYLMRNASKKLNGIRIGNKEYGMRQGKKTPT
jgi:hypothetical protein